MPSTKYSGFGLVDVIVGIALMLVLFLALFGALRASLMLSALAKAKATAVELASTQMEYLRGLSYDSLGTTGGIPSGLVPQIATTTVDGIVYTTRTFIQYKDDPADGIGAQDANGITTDYKIGRVTVSYSMKELAKSINLVSNFTPPSIETTTGGGTLSIRVVDAASVGVSNASIRIVNTSTSPTIDFTTFTNTDGYAVIGGAATSSQYQIYVSRTGYSSAQTYERTSQNVNPTPGYLTVVKDQVTGATFFIDRLSTLILASFSPATTNSFNDSFNNSSNLASQTNTQVSDGMLSLSNEELSGTARSVAISPSYLAGWGLLSASLSEPSGTTAVIRVTDATGAVLPDSALAGNAAGFSSFPVSLTGISASSYPALTIFAELTSNSTTTTPSILDWSLSHTDGPTPLSNIAFTLTGAKTIGTDANNAPIYKTVVGGTTGANASKTEVLEWDLYSLATNNLIESCQASPFSLAPGSVTNVAFLTGSPTAHTLSAKVKNSADADVAYAKIVLTKSGYAATIPTSLCGLAYFGGLASGSYSATVSATGYATTTFSNINVTGQATTTLTLP
jgi:hypothetical protein